MYNFVHFYFLFFVHFNFIIYTEIEEVCDIKISDEHEEYKWCSYVEAKKYLKWEHNLKALEKLMQKV